MSAAKANKTRTITGHKAVREALRDTQTYSSDLQGDADVRDYRQIPLEIDPPRHHLYRAALAPFFVKPTVERYSAEFYSNAESQISHFFQNPGQDVIADLALPIVMQNLGALYHRPHDVQEWISWGPDVWTAAGPTRDGAILHAYLDRVYAEAIEIIEAKKRDVWSDVAQIEIEGERITQTEFKGIAGVLLAGGRDTVIKLLTGMVWYFGSHLAELELLRSDRARIDSAVQEFLRFFTPLPEMARTIVAESNALNLPEDRYVGISFISGNFDATVFDNPLEISLERPRNPHLSFGFGPHTCLGNHLAEIEAKVFLNALLDSGYIWEVSEEEITFHAGEYSVVPDRFERIRLSQR